ncbi:TIGR03621 family F420-dependent LLM class oxidoreductase [Mycolicibacterium moriokaense]|nr:TIGR03621 family F420-dependent LLM class oxidoreductase [Mycolicibacterium moriokaense]
MGNRPIRFGTGGGGVADRDRLIAAARRAEDIGYSTFSMADHFGLPLAPLIALQAVADATKTLRITQTVLAQDFRHPAVLAKELATLDVLSGGRVEIGLGAGWMQTEYDQAGIPFDAATARVARLEESAIILKGLFGDSPFSFSGEHFCISNLDGTPKPVQRPHPPILIGGGGRKLLAAAARHADIIQVMPRIRPPGQPIDAAEFSATTYRSKIDHIKAVAGERFSRIELGTQLLLATVTDDPDGTLERFAAGYHLRGEDLRASPLVAVGSLSEVCVKLIGLRDEYGLNYFACPMGVKPSSLAPIIEKVAGS